MTGAEVPLPLDGGLATGPGCDSQDTTRLWPYLWRNMKAKYRERIVRACRRGKRHPESHTREAVEEGERLSMQFAEHIACMGLQQFDGMPHKQEELIMLIIDEEEMFNIEYNNEAEKYTQVATIHRDRRNGGTMWQLPHNPENVTTKKMWQMQTEN